MLSWIKTIARLTKKASGGIGNVTDAAAVGYGENMLLS